MLSLIVAMGADNVIGVNNQMPWHLPADLKHFKQITSGHCVVMGRKTFDSIGKPLPNRRNVVISRTVKSIPGCDVSASLDEALELCAAEAEVFIIGGAEIFSQAMNIADHIYLTIIHHQFKGDTFFPLIDPLIWVEIKREDFLADEKNPFSYSFLQLRKNL